MIVATSRIAVWRRKLRKTLVVRRSGNGKLGRGVGATYRPVGDTCPAHCAMLKGPCYAKGGRTHIFAVSAKLRADSLTKLRPRGLVRFCVSGDWVNRSGSLDKRHAAACITWAHDHPSVTAWSYTHAPEAFDRVGLGPTSWPPNLAILASVPSRAAARHYRELGWRTARVVARPDSPLDPQEVLCPHDVAKFNGAPESERITCAECQLCFPGRTHSIAFTLITRKHKEINNVDQTAGAPSVLGESQDH